MGCVVAFRLFGSFIARRNGPDGPPLQVTPRKARALLAYLALNAGEEVERGLLGNLLWGGDGDARHNLRQALVTIRKGLGPDADRLLDIGRHTVRLVRETTAVDALTFAEAAAQGDNETACGLFAPGFLANLDTISDGFDDWARGERERLGGIAAALFIRLARAADLAGDGERAATYAERLVAIDRLREDWQRMSIGLQARYRGRAAALGYATRVFSLLRRELSVEPEEATLRLVESIRHGEERRTIPFEIHAA